jgi:hypothetical protein
MQSTSGACLYFSVESPDFPTQYYSVGHPGNPLFLHPRIFPGVLARQPLKRLFTLPGH